MNDEMRKRLEAKAADDAEAADGWELAGCEAGRVARLRRQVADLRAALAEVDRLRAERDAIAGLMMFTPALGCGVGVVFPGKPGPHNVCCVDRMAALDMVRMAAGLEPEGR